MKRYSTEKCLKQTSSSKSLSKQENCSSKPQIGQLPPTSQSRKQNRKKSSNDSKCDTKQKKQVSDSVQRNSCQEMTPQNQSSYRDYLHGEMKENIFHQQSKLLKMKQQENTEYTLRDKITRSSSSFQEKFEEIYNKLSGQTQRDSRLQNKTDFNKTEDQIWLKQNDAVSRGRNVLTENTLESSRRMNQIKQEDDQFIQSGQKNSLGRLQSSLNNMRVFNQSQYTPLQVSKKVDMCSILDNTINANTIKLGNDTIRKYNENTDNVDLVKHKNDQITELTKQLTQQKIQNERLQRKILELEYEMENSQKDNKNVENIQFMEKVVEERQISIRKSELEIEEITKELKKESESIVKSRVQLQQDQLIHKKQIELLGKEQEKLNEESKKLKLWEEKLSEQDRLLKERILKFENRDELLSEKEKAIKRHESQVEQKRVFVLQLIERLGQHDEQLYSYAKQCEQRCEKIDQFQNILYNQVVQYDDMDLRMEGLRLNESIFQKKMDLEISQCLTQVQKLKERESNLEKREKSIKSQHEKLQQQQSQQKLAKSLDKPIALSEYSNLKQSGQSSRNNRNNNTSQNENIAQNAQNISVSVTNVSGNTSQLKLKNKNNSSSSQNGSSKNFKRINTSQQNQSMQLNSNVHEHLKEKPENSNSRNSNTAQRKRRSESHQTLTHSAINLNNISNNYTYQNDGQTTQLSFDNNLDLTLTNQQNSMNPAIKLNQFASQEDISVVLAPSNMQNNGILMTSYHIDEDIAYLCQDGQKEGDQIRQISIMASPQLHYSEKERLQQQTLQDQYQTFQNDQVVENVLTKGGTSVSKQSEQLLQVDLSSLQSKNDDKFMTNQQNVFSNNQFLSLPIQQFQQGHEFTNQFNPGSIQNEIIQDDNLLSNRDYFNTDELELIRKNRKGNQTPSQNQRSTSSKKPNNGAYILHEITQNYSNDKSNQFQSKSLVQQRISRDNISNQ